VEPQTGRRVEPGRGPETRGQLPAPPLAKRPAELSAAESELFECLRLAGSALTVRQLEARSESGAAVEATLHLLIERGLVARLNTIVPSYTCRRADAGVHAE
jgi:hypothetical protein